MPENDREILIADAYANNPDSNNFIQLGEEIELETEEDTMTVTMVGTYGKPGSSNPSFEILFPIVNRLGLTTSNLFSVEPDEHEEEVNRFLGKFRACNRANQMVLLNTLDFLAEQLLALQGDDPSD